MTSSSEIHTTIVALEADFMSTFKAGDAAGIAACYSSDAQLLPPNSDIISGQEGIQAAFQSFMDMGIREMRLDTLEVNSGGDLAYEVGKYSLVVEGGQIADQGKYIVVWKREADQWKLHRDIFNTSMPAPE